MNFKAKKQVILTDCIFFNAEMRKKYVLKAMLAYRGAAFGVCVFVQSDGYTSALTLIFVLSLKNGSV